MTTSLHLAQSNETEYLMKVKKKKNYLPDKY